jgi:hypothetical protein
VSAVPANAVDSYELLRAAVLRADPDAGPNLAVLRREGLTAWSRSLIETGDIDAPLPELTMSEIVRRAISAFLSAARGHG